MRVPPTGLAASNHPMHSTGSPETANYHSRYQRTARVSGALAGVDWWQGVTLLMLEQTWVEMRDLAKLLARRSHKIFASASRTSWATPPRSGDGRCQPSGATDLDLD